MGGREVLGAELWKKNPLYASRTCDFRVASRFSRESPAPGVSFLLCWFVILHKSHVGKLQVDESRESLDLPRSCELGNEIGETSIFKFQVHLKVIR